MALSIIEILGKGRFNQMRSGCTAGKGRLGQKKCGLSRLLNFGRICTMGQIVGSHMSWSKKMDLKP